MGSFFFFFFDFSPSNPQIKSKLLKDLLRCFRGSFNYRTAADEIGANLHQFTINSHRLCHCGRKESPHKGGGEVGGREGGGGRG